MSTPIIIIFAIQVVKKVEQNINWIQDITVMSIISWQKYIMYESEVCSGLCFAAVS